MESPGTQSRQRRRLLDTLFLLAVLCAAALTPIRHLAAGNEPDLWWHLRAGAWILHHRSIPSTDLFSSATMGRPWIVYTWLFDVLCAGLYGLWGLRGILGMTAFLTLANTAVLSGFLMRYVSPRRALALGVLAHLAMLPLDTPRPWLFTILFFTVELWWLVNACERRRPLWLLPIVPLMAVWANMHVQFIYGLGLAGLFALVYLKRSRQLALWLWMVTAASFLATLANPYGLRLYGVVFQYATQKAPFSVIQEMQPLSFRDISSWVTLLLVVSAAFALGGARTRSTLLLALFAVSCVFGFRAGRDLWFPVTISTIILATRFSPSERAPEISYRKSWTLALPLSCIFVLWILVHVPESALQKKVDRNFPVAAAAWARSHPLPGPLYNSFDWGGYLIWGLPQMPVSIDGRANLHGDQRLVRSIATVRGSQNWAADPELARARTIILESRLPLASILRADPAFRLIYEDRITSIFQPVASQDSPHQSR